MMRPFSAPASRRQLALACVGIVLCASAAIAVHGLPVVDEYAHYYQIQEFLRGRYRPIDGLTTIPGYHALAAIVLKVAQVESLSLARVVTMAFALASLPAFAGIRRALDPGADPLRPTLQFLFFPIYFPFCFLVYTDVASVALVLWTLLCALTGRHWLAGLLGLASLCVRQNNVMWIGFIALLVAQQIWAAHPTPRERWCAARALVPYALCAAAFAGYWRWNGSIAMSHVGGEMHPDLTLHAGNLYFMLFLAGLFLAPLMAIWLPRYLAAVRSRPLLLAIPLLGGVVYTGAFVVDHIANTFGMDYYLRNFTLVYVTEHPAAFVGFGAVAVAAACGLTQVRWQRASFALLLPTAMLFVSFSWLIEQRYYLIPFALLFALRRAEDRRVERLLLALWIPVAVWFLYGIVTKDFFL